ncbi:MAG: Ni/Fe hydrogenase subunit alpha [Candidatus Brocadiia bacterium]|nr:MAG: Ni/Fe hydrogenase subunit alpha [Candidatus Brocadiia bacterium]
MGTDLNINVKHITRVEGHGNIAVNAKNGKIEKIQWQVPEAPRFFEAMVRGRSYQDIQTIVSRICGICSISHSLVATKAVENALGIEVSQQTNLVRRLLHYSEQLQSHVLHVGYLIAPDLFGVKSVVPLVGMAKDAVLTIVKAHRIANQWSELLGGRITHPVTIIPGGMTRFPTEQQLRELLETLKSIIPDVYAIADVVYSVAGNVPAFDRPTEYVSLYEPDYYAFYDKEIVSTDGFRAPVSDWEKVANEYVVDQSTAKWAKWHRSSYAVGALARFNNNYDQLADASKKLAARFGLKKGCCNPYMNSVAQLVECPEIIVSSMAIIEKLLSKGVVEEKVKVTPKAGKGAAGIEAPRGVLFHSYEFDKNGNCVAANQCIPTNQNHANIQLDFEKIVPEIINEGQDAVRLKLEMLVRAYDPCISCSTHMLDVKFV